MTFKQLVLEIAKEEGKKEEVDIAQISEITSITLRKLAKLEVSDLVSLLGAFDEP